jgi:hypothetical protein
MKRKHLIAVPPKKLWAVIYPIDMVKSRMQTDGFSPSDGQKYRSTLHCVRTVWKSEGIGAFTRGLGPTLIRCVRHDFAPFLMVAEVLAHTGLRLRMAQHSWDSRWRTAF